MKDVDTAIKWYEETRPLYKSLASKVADIIKENLEQKKIQYHSVTSRGKTLESFANKVKSGRYGDPKKEIKDTAGIRIITYLESDVLKVADITEKLFSIDKPNSLDQAQLLGSDRLGYRSVHYVAKFDKIRCRLPECAVYKNLSFEIQIRSLLQHAWAEIEHDRNYKFVGKLPIELERRFYLVAGMLECADREFVSIAQEIDKYKTIVAEEIEKGDLNIDINTASLKEYLPSKFSKLIHGDLLVTKFGPDDSLAKEIVEDVQLFGISKIRQLDMIIPDDLEANILKFGDENNFAGIIRLILMINDAERYFEHSWRNNWNTLHSWTAELMGQYNVNVAHLKKYVKID